MMSRNIGDVESCLLCFAGPNIVMDPALAFGKRPGTPFFSQPYNDYHFDTIINVEEWRNTDEQTSAKKPWFYEKYLKKNKTTYERIPLECNKEDDDDCESVDQDALILSCVQRVVDMLKRGRRVFIYGPVCNRVACMVALLAWARYANDKNVLETLRHDVLLDIPALCEDFPATTRHVAQYERLLKSHRHTIVACFERQPKKIKI